LDIFNRTTYIVLFNICFYFFLWLFLNLIAMHSFIASIPEFFRAVWAYVVALFFFYRKDAAPDIEAGIVPLEVIQPSEPVNGEHDTVFYFLFSTPMIDTQLSKALMVSPLPMGSLKQPSVRTGTLTIPSPFAPITVVVRVEHPPSTPSSVVSSTLLSTKSRIKPLVSALILFSGHIF
jgi:hypothetical protein